MKLIFEEAKRLLALNSVGQHGNEEVTNTILALLNSRGLKTNVQKITHASEELSSRQYNIIGVLGDPLVDRKTRKGLLLSAQLDTNTPGLPAAWTETGGNPFNPVLKDGRLYGLGAAGGKVDFLCKLHALDRFREKKLKQPVYLVGTTGSESGMLGANYLIKSYALNPKCVVVNEPTGFALLKSHKSLMIYRISIEYQLVERDARGFNRRIDFHSLGKMAHGSDPGRGLNAISELLWFIEKVSDNGFEVRFTKLSGGDSLNKVPDYAFCQFYLTSYQFEDFKPFFRDITKSGKKENQFKVELGGLGDIGVRFLPERVIHCMQELVHFFSAVEAEMKKIKNADFQPEHSTINLSKLEQGPTGLQMFFDFRCVPDIALDQLHQKVLEGIREMSAHFPELNVKIHRERANFGYRADEAGELARICQESLEKADLPTKWICKSSASEAALFAQAGYETISVGPGEALGVAQSANEYIETSAIDRAVDFYSNVIEKACL